MIVKSSNEWQMLTRTKHMFMHNLGHWKIKLDVNKICTECLIYLHILEENRLECMYNTKYYININRILNPK